MLHNAKFAVFPRDPYKSHEFHAIAMQNFWMLKPVVREVTGRL